MSSKSKVNAKTVQEYLKNILNSGSNQIIKHVDQLSEVLIQIKNEKLSNNDIIDIGNKYGKDLLKLSRTGLSQVSGKGTDKDLSEKDIMMILNGCLYGLHIIIICNQAAHSLNNKKEMTTNPLFKEMEIEKCIYHLVAKSCELKLKNNVKEGLLLLKILINSMNDDQTKLNEEEEEDSLMYFPEPDKSMSCELLRLVAGVLINAVTSMATHESSSTVFI